MNILMSLTTDSMAKESCPKLNPQPGQGLNPRPPGWQAEIYSTALTSHTILHVSCKHFCGVCCFSTHGYW